MTAKKTEIPVAPEGGDNVEEKADAPAENAEAPEDSAASEAETTEESQDDPVDSAKAAVMEPEAPKTVELEKGEVMFVGAEVGMSCKKFGTRYMKDVPQKASAKEVKYLKETFDSEKNKGSVFVFG